LNPGFTEQAVLLGPWRSLIGIVTRPNSPQPARPGIIILNTGIIHRVGHHRMYVTMSRALARLGHTVLRFDLSGIGDSDERPDQLSPLKSSLSDIKDAVDMLERDHGSQRVVLMGLCSGADHAILYGSTDARVVGLVLMDPTLPPTARYYFHYVAQRLVRLRNWVSVATGRSGLMRLLLRKWRHDVSKTRPELTLENLAFSPHLASSYASAVKSGMQILAAFTSLSPRHTYLQQMLDAFPGVAFNNQLKLESFPDSDHIFTAQKDRDRLLHVITDWLALEPLSAQSTPH